MVSTTITTANEVKLDKLVMARGVLAREAGFGAAVLKLLGPGTAADNARDKFLTSTYINQPQLHAEALKLDQFLESLPPAQRKQLADRGMALAGRITPGEDYKWKDDEYLARGARWVSYIKLTSLDIPSKLMVLQKHGGDISIAINAGLAETSPDRRSYTLMRNISVTDMSALPKATAQKVLNEIEKTGYEPILVTPVVAHTLLKTYVPAQKAIMQLLDAGATFKPQQPTDNPLFKKISPGSKAYVPTPLEAAASIDREPGLPLLKRVLATGEKAGRENVPAIRVLLYGVLAEPDAESLGKDLKTLKELGFDINARGRLNRTAIIIATQKEELDSSARDRQYLSSYLVDEAQAKAIIFRILSNAGANPALQDATGRTAHSNLRTVTETANAAIRQEAVAAAREKADELREIQKEAAGRLLPMPSMAGATARTP